MILSDFILTKQRQIKALFPKRNVLCFAGANAMVRHRRVKQHRRDELREAIREIRLAISPETAQFVADRVKHHVKPAF